MDESVDVVVVGGGPVGLLTAIELKLGGASVMVLERLREPSVAMKAMSVGPLASEALQRRGMADALAAAEARAQAAVQAFGARAGLDPRGRDARFAGHFGGLLIRRNAFDEPERRARPIVQADLELLLAERASALGIDLRREHEVVDLVHDANRVAVDWAGSHGQGRVESAYLVGCDGGRSSVRKLAGFDFPGTPPTATLYQVIAELDHPERLLPIGWRRTAHGVFSYGPIPDRLFMLSFDGPPLERGTPPRQEEIERVLRHISGADVRVKTLHGASRWADNTRLADTYRRGRVLLAGDAAHVHSPFGGQGLGLGLVDAANLGWKLAAVVRGEMPPSLLDTYTTERRPVARAVLDNTLAQTALLRPDPQSGALRELMETLLQVDDVNRLIGAMTRGLTTRYEIGDRHDPGTSRLGRLVGDETIVRGATSMGLYALMQGGAAVLLDASRDRSVTRLVMAHTRRVRCVAIDTGPSRLIRPDACVAWSSDLEQATDSDALPGLMDALTRWFGAAPSA